MADVNDLNSALSVKIAGADNTGLETNFMNVDSSGRPTAKVQLYDAAGTALTSTTVTAKQALDVNVTNQITSSPLPATGSAFSFGDITTAVATPFNIQRTVYTEQIINSTMTLVSSNLNDTSAGTGARTVQVTYLDATMAGPFTTTFILNGLIAVTASVSNMCYIEKMVVLTSGSTNSNVGILTLKTGLTTVGTIAATDNQTFWAHHYVPTGKTTYISGVSLGSNATTVGAGAVYILKGSKPTIANATEIQISDFITLYGQSSTVTRSYFSPIQFIGPGRIRAIVTPTTSSSLISRCSFDYIDN